MTIKTCYHNINFEDDNILSMQNEKILKKVQDSINNLPALKILNNKLLLTSIIDQISKFVKNKKLFLVLGTGGSNLGAKALINILQGNEKNKIIFFDNIDPINFENSINKLDLLNAGFIVISKSGKTPETLSQFASLIEIFDQKNSLNNFYKNVLIITEDKPSPLANIAHSNNCYIMNHEKEIGGRFSIFSNVGMIPAIIAGLDVKKIHEGAYQEVKNQSSNEFLNIACFFRYQKINPNINNSVLMTYSDALFYFGKWYLQLWSESIGKNGKGITPIHSVGTTDQHSQLQLYLDGPKDKFFTFITTEHSSKGLKLHQKTMEKQDLKYLSNKTMGDLMQAEQRATIDTFIQNEFPVREINLNQINEFSIGKLMAFSMMETIATCIFFDVNTFDQPAVEQGKILTKKYLS